jgi:hypothetical protein
LKKKETERKGGLKSGKHNENIIDNDNTNLLRVVVNQLAVDKDVATVRNDLLDLLLHLFLLSGLNRRQFLHSVHTDASTKDLNLQSTPQALEQPISQYNDFNNKKKL